MSKPRIWYLPTPSHTRLVFTQELYERLTARFEVVANETEDPYTQAQIEASIASFDGVITGWGTAAISDEALQRAKRLRIVAHSAGSVKYLFTEAAVKEQLLPRDISVVSANGAIALNVAEHTLGSLIAVSRRWSSLTQNIRETKTWKDPSMPRSAQYLRGAKVGIVSASTVGREVIRLLGPFDVDIRIFDPYLSDWDAGHLGVTKVCLNDLFRESDMVTVHAPSIPETRHMIGAEQLRLLRDGATFINTSRGSVLDHDALFREAQTGRILVHLDVTDPEPLPPDHPLRPLENVTITPHTSGSGTYGYHEIGSTVVRALEHYFNGQSVPGRVPLDKWEQLA